MVVDKIVVGAVALFLAAALAVGLSALVTSCDDQSGGYPTPQVHVDVDHPKPKTRKPAPRAKQPNAPSIPKQRTGSGRR